jgi:hypothetical protein
MIQLLNSIIDFFSYKTIDREFAFLNGSREIFTIGNVNPIKIILIPSWENKVLMSECYDLDMAKFAFNLTVPSDQNTSTTLDVIHYFNHSNEEYRLEVKRNLSSLDRFYIKLKIKN